MVFQRHLGHLAHSKLEQIITFQEKLLGNISSLILENNIHISGFAGDSTEDKNLMIIGSIRQKQNSDFVTERPMAWSKLSMGTVF